MKHDPHACDPPGTADLERMHRHLLGDLEPEEFAQLEQDLLSSPEMRTRYLRAVRTEVALHERAGAAAAQATTEAPRRNPWLRAAGIDVTDIYPYLTELYEESPPLTYQPGDATVHDGLCVHAALENPTDRPRWACILPYHPADTQYTGSPHHIFRADIGLELDKPIRHPEYFPVIFP